MYIFSRIAYCFSLKISGNNSYISVPAALTAFLSYSNFWEQFLHICSSSTYCFSFIISEKNSYISVPAALAAFLL
jgi:hypothetical protein